MQQSRQQYRPRRRLHAAVVAALAAVLLWSDPAQTQLFGRAELPITGVAETPLVNRSLSASERKQVASLKAVAVIGNPKGNVTLHKFYDLNCSHCRRASADINAMLKTDAQLRVVLVPYAVLSVASIQAAMVELAVMEFVPGRIAEFHRRVYAQRGTIDGERALTVAKSMGLDPQKLIVRANAGDATSALKLHAMLGGDLGLRATPAYVAGGVAISGHPGRESLQRIVASIRKCGRPVC